MLGFVKRNFPLAPLSLKLLLYKFLIHSKLKYASTIWDSAKTLALSLEAVRNRLFHTRHLSSLIECDSNENDLRAARPPPPHKSMPAWLTSQGLPDNPSPCQPLLTQPSYLSSRVNHRNKVGIPHYHSLTFNQSFIPTTSLDWNGLPSPIADVIESAKFNNAMCEFVLCSY